MSWEIRLHLEGLPAQQAQEMDLARPRCKGMISEKSVANPAADRPTMRHQRQLARNKSNIERLVSTPAGSAVQLRKPPTVEHELT